MGFVVTTFVAVRHQVSKIVLTATIARPAAIGFFVV
jgi:hypothetical protein